MDPDYLKIQAFWDDEPCGTQHLEELPGSREYFQQFDPYYEGLYPYLLPFLNIKEMAGKTVLEIGLGSGFTLQRIAAVAGKCYGLDLSEQTIMLNQNRKAIFALDRLELIQASATDIPLPDQSVDCVVSIGCLHHIPDIDLALGEIARVLKPGGVIKGMVYYRNSYRNLVYIPLARMLHPKWRGKSWQQCVNMMYDGDNNPYGTVYSKEEMNRILVGFRDIKYQVQNFVGGEVIPYIGNRVPRGFWLNTVGKIMGLDLYFTAIRDIE